ncbi:MAG: hypothetical protein RX317_06020 [bacterium]|nr:hypothetical protein [bacterium]
MGIAEEQNRLIRGRVLKLLRAVNLNHIAADVLVATLVGCGHRLTIDSLLAILQYLVDKGYVEVRESKLEGVGTVTTARITALGIDLLEASVEDPGVAL